MPRRAPPMLARMSDPKPPVPVPKRVPVAAQLSADVYDAPGGDAYVLEIPVPGVKPEDIAIEVTVGTITVSTERRPAPEEAKRNYLQREQAPSAMSRIFEFPMELDTDNVRATLEHGVLKIVARKALAGRRRELRVGQAA